MAVILCCGHECGIRTHGFPLMETGWEGVSRTVSYSSVCHECYMDTLVSRPETVIFYEYEADEYLELELDE